MEKELFRV